MVVKGHNVVIQYNPRQDYRSKTFTIIYLSITTFYNIISGIPDASNALTYFP